MCQQKGDTSVVFPFVLCSGVDVLCCLNLMYVFRRCRNQHSLAFQIPSASKEAYKSSFFPQTIRDWNDLPDSLVSSAEMSDDCVSKFASLVRSRD